jgi:DNA end-binding protein Ku
VYYDHPYFLAPVGDSEGPRRAYQLLLEAMRRSERVAIGRFVMRTKEYLVAIRVRDDRLALSTMLLRDEIRPAKDIETGGRKPPKRQLEQAVALIDPLSGDWNPADFKDCYRARLEDVIARKRKGKRISAPEREKEPSPAPDLMAALERSLAEATGGARDTNPRKAGTSERALDDMSRDELYEQAQEQNIPGRSSMSKKQLVDALSG